MPKKPVRTFRDLEIYQKSIASAVIISKDIAPVLAKQKYAFSERMIECALAVPLLVAEAHSLRFADFALGIGYLEKAMSASNKMVVYLEHARGMVGTKLDGALVEDLVGRYTDCRTKMFHLEKSWKYFRTVYADEAAGKGKGNFKY